MDNHNGILATRTRGNFEAVDLGSSILARFPRQLYAFFGVPLCASAIILVLALPGIPWLPPALLWLLKPLWDRLLILPASVLVFNPKAAFAELGRSLGKIKLPRLLFDLTVGRFNIYRSYLLPSVLLEGLSGGHLKKRLNLLATRQNNGSAGLSLTFLAIELLMLFSWLPLFAAAFPGLVPLDFDDKFFLPARIFTALQVLGMLILEPHYALGGFCMYLNSRTIMEGWDLDLVFKRMAAKNEILKTLLLVLALNLIPFDSFAQEAYLERERKWSQAANETLAHPDFGSDTDITVWRPKKIPIQEARVVKPDAGINFGTALGGRLLLIIVLGFGIIVLGFLAASLLKRYGTGGKTKPELKRAAILFASEENPRPNAPVQEYWYTRSMELWTADRKHDALALLYRESIRFLGTDGGNHIPASATEEECVRIINSGLRKNLPAGSYFTRLAQTRVAETYACRTATEADFLHLRNGLFELETIGGVK